jgi:hypothetical protein
MSYTGQYSVIYTPYALDPSEDVTDFVIGVTLEVGRKRIIDRWTPNTVRVEMIDPKPTEPFRVGGFLTVNGIGFAITSIDRNYGIPYISATNIAWEDRVTIEAESYGLYKAARRQEINTTLVEDDAQEYVLNAVGLTSATPDNDFDGPAWKTFNCKATNFNGTALDLLNSVLNGVIGYVHDPGTFDDLTGYNGMSFASAGQFGSGNAINFTDTGSQSSATNTYFYDQIQFATNSENAYGNVAVTYNVGAGTAQAVAGVLNNAYQTNTALKNLADADQTADVLLAIFGQAEIVPYAISTTSAIVSAYDLDDQTTYTLPGTRVSITFRGTTYNAICEGFIVTQDTQQARYTYYFSPVLGQALILDSTQFGILDTNVLALG